LLEDTSIRVGNDEYARANGSFGLSTLQDRHAKVGTHTVQFSFAGKSGVKHDLELRDRQLARIVREARALPGRELFQYVDAEGRTHDIKADDVNDYLRRIAGSEFSAKDFRTWAGTVFAAVALCERGRFETQRQAKRNIKEAITSVASRLGNTPAVCRKAYIHPGIFEHYLAGRSAKIVVPIKATRRYPRGALRPEETAVLALLRRRPPAPPSLTTALRRSLVQARARSGGAGDGGRAATKSRPRKSRSSPRRQSPG
jgi:DNA topoisomerase-1